MSLIVACPNCQTRYNLPPKFEGKKVKCKSCGKPFSASVGEARVKSGARQQQAVAKVRQTDPDELAKMGIGTIRSAPDPFAAPVHTGPDPLRNHVVQDPGFALPTVTDSPASSDHGTDDSMDDVVANPYIQSLPKPSASGSRPPKRARRGKVVPTPVGFGDVFKTAWDVFGSNLGILLGTTFLLVVVGAGIGLLQFFLPFILVSLGAEGIISYVTPVVGIIGNAIQIFLTLGQTLIILKLLRRQQTGFGDLFSGASVFSPLLTGLIIFMIGIILGTLLFVLPALIFAVFFWPYYYLIADEKAKPFESFGVAKSIAASNIGTIFVLGLVSVGLYLLGGLALGIGLFFAAPLVSVLWGAAYLMMSGLVQPQS